MNYIGLVKYHMKYELFQLIICSLMLVFAVGFIIYNKTPAFGFIVVTVLFLFFVGKYFYKQQRLINDYNKLSTIEKAEIDNDLQTNTVFIGRDYSLSKKFIVDFKYCKIIPISSIVLINQSKGEELFTARRVVLVDVVYLYTLEKKYGLINQTHSLVSIEGGAYYKHLYDYVKKQNPNVLEGYTKENIKIIKEKYNINDW